MSKFEEIKGVVIGDDGFKLELPVVEESTAATRDFSKLKASTDGKQGKEYWRSLEEWGNTSEFQEFVNTEYPSQTEMIIDPVSRRGFLKLMGASLALAGFSSCVYQPKEDIVPYIKQPEEEVPGKALFFATAMPLGGAALPLLVRSNEGRPTKIEGNPDHPASMGATDIYAQGTLLTLYDPDRAKSVTYLGEPRSWSGFLTEFRASLDQQKARGGAGLRLLTETVVSPTLARQIKELQAAFPQMKWHQWEPGSVTGAMAGAQAAFGQNVQATYKFDKADCILSLDADFLNNGPANVRYARDFSKKRRVSKDKMEMNRLYAVEVTPTLTGSVADHRVGVRPSEFENFVRAIAYASGVNAGASNSDAVTKHADWIKAVVKDLQAHRGTSVVVAGDAQPAAVHAIAHALNGALGNIGQTVFYSDAVEASPVDHMASLGELVRDMDAGAVDTLLIMGGNPVFTAPADYAFAQRLAKVRLRVHHGLFHDETSELCHWHIPSTHFLEQWSDARASDGSVLIVQPLIAPLYQSKSDHEVLAAFGQNPDQTSYDLVQQTWKAQASGGFDSFWRKAVHDGYLMNTASQPKTVSAGNAQAIAPTAPAAAAGDLDIVFRLDPTIHDGRFANNGWLQELPKPLTKLTWENVAYISPATARKYGIEAKVGTKGGNYMVDVLELDYQGRKVLAPAWVLPGQPDDTVTVHLGYGRAKAGKVGTGIGFNSYAIWTSASPWFGTGLKIRRTGDTVSVAGVQTHFTMEERDPVRAVTLEEYKEKREAFHEEEEPQKTFSMYPPVEYKGHKWGMAIDLNSCVGCSACIIACVAENNIPVVGKEQIERHRMMHWLRVDRYYRGEGDDPLEAYFQPVPCMQCENAPCEVVCPVNATVHSTEGLNDMVYNRCVGTRYCSNNCPYKVRRFNYLLFQDWTTPQMKLVRNPEVSVRSRGVMEKCTYCVQRIQNVKIEAERQNRPIMDGEIKTACQTVCPTEAISFGDINDPKSQVAQLKQDTRNYSLLAELNTQPRTTYLGALRNPNPEISSQKKEAKRA